jgi:hypothetical protein
MPIDESVPEVPSVFPGTSEKNEIRSLLGPGPGDVVVPKVSENEYKAARATVDLIHGPDYPVPLADILYAAAHARASEPWSCPMGDDVCADCGYRCDGPVSAESAQMAQRILQAALRAFPKDDYASGLALYIRDCVQKASALLSGWRP